MMEKLLTTRTWLREFFAEFLGTLFLVMLGDAAVAQMFIRSGGVNNDFLSVGLGYGLAAAFAVYICGGVSGGHINPAVSLTMCIFGRLSWYKLPIYWLAQYLGAFVGAGILYFTYFDTISNLNLLKDQAGNALVFTPGIFATYPAGHMNLFPAFLDQLVGTAILLMVVFALTDDRNAGIPKHFTPLLVGLVISVIGMTYGAQCGFAINPARDFAPRLFTAIVNGAQVFSKGSDKFGFFFWIPILAPHVGAVVGAFIYQVLIGNHWPPVYEVSAIPTANGENFLHSKAREVMENETCLAVGPTGQLAYQYRTDVEVIRKRSKVP